MTRRVLVLIVLTALLYPPVIQAQSIDQLRQRREQLARDIERNRAAAEQKKKEAQQLAGQIAKIDQDISQTESRIESTEAQINDTIQTIEVLNTKIAEKQKELEIAFDRQNEALRTIYETTDQNFVFLVAGPTLSDAVDRAEYLSALESTIERTIQEIGELKAQLQQQKKEQEERQVYLGGLKRKQEAYRQGLDSSKQQKNQLLGGAKQAQKTYEQLLEEARRAYSDVNSELFRITQLAKNRGRTSGAKRIGNLSWHWPFDGLITAGWCVPLFYTTCHTGIDVDGEIGDPVVAAANGTVTVVAGDPAHGYGYFVKVSHGNGVETLYAHCHSFNVSVGDQVEGGKSIVCFMGNTGLARAIHPGGNGSHLHFEVREDGVPVNPLIYLP